jgi:hypothetical protein
MSKFTTDPSQSWDCVPKGEYTILIEKADRKKPKEGEHDYIECHMRVAEGEFQNRSIVDRLSLSPKARARLSQLVKACGLASANEKGEIEYDTDDLKGCVVVVRGEPEAYQGMEFFRPRRYIMHPTVAAKLEGQVAQQTGATTGDAPPATAPAAAPKQAPAKGVKI